MLKVTLNAFATILALSGYILTYALNKDKLRRYRLQLLLVALLAPALIWGDYIHESRESASLHGKLSTIVEQNQVLISEKDSLTARIRFVQNDVRELRGEREELASLLEPFQYRARTSYPGLDDHVALGKLASDISGMQPELVFLGQSEPRRNSSTNLVHTTYGFRSRYPVGLRDIQIRVRFDARFAAVSHDMTGALVEQYGTRMIADADSSGFSYSTGYLREGNDIHIEVTSASPLRIMSLDLLP